MADLMGTRRASGKKAGRREAPQKSGEWLDDVEPNVVVSGGWGRSPPPPARPPASVGAGSRIWPRAGPSALARARARGGGAAAAQPPLGSRCCSCTARRLCAGARAAPARRTAVNVLVFGEVARTARRAVGRHMECARVERARRRRRDESRRFWRRCSTSWSCAS